LEGKECFDVMIDDVIPRTIDGILRGVGLDIGCLKRFLTIDMNTKWKKSLIIGNDLLRIVEDLKMNRNPLILALQLLSGELHL